VEGKVDFDVLKQLLGGVVDDKEEKYGLNWHGKRRARQLALTPSTGTLRPCPEDSVDWETTQNLMIEGDNLEVLKLLQKSYAGKVKLIYIDPPYNTGKDFVYPDDFRDNIKNYLELTGQTGENGRLSSNTEASGRFHTNWLNMMYPRLMVARDMLREDGVIFVSVGDNELSNLKRICEDIFGEENYINTVSIHMKNIAGASGGGEDKRLKKNIEYLVVLAKNYESLQPFENAYKLIPISELVQQYREEGISWKYTSVLVSDGEKTYIGSTVDGENNEIKIYSRIHPIIKSVKQVMRDEEMTESEVYARYARRIFQTEMPQSSIRPRVMRKMEAMGLTNDLCSIEYVPRSGRNKGVVYEQFYKGDNFRLLAWLDHVAEEIDGQLYKKELQGTFWDFVGETKNLTREGDTPLPNGKKPLALLSRLLELDGSKDSLILDFFAGSGTTGHAVIASNAKDDKNRKFILVQLPEPLDPDNRDQEAATEFCDSLGKPRNIAELTKERLRRASAKVKAENPLFSGDTGFRVFKLDSSNLRTWDPDAANLDANLLDSVEHIKDSRTESDVLYELLLKLGLELTVPTATRTIAGKTVYSVGAGTLLACLTDTIARTDAEALALGIADWHAEQNPAGETTCVFRDSAFADDVAKTNLAAILEQHSLTNVRSL
jgi:adenine-specific DNA-methyltransferase